MSRPTSWARHSYPIQTSPEHSSQAEPPPGFNAAASFIGPEIPKLPKNVRALRDANAFEARGRTIIICLDGTGDKFDSDNSNIVHLVSCLKKDDSSQVTYYQSGIGTYGSGGLSNGIAAAVDMAVGSGLGVHIRDAYRFLMQTYREGDKICLFGFSRGAYTARCLAGMLHKVGLLPAHNRAQIPFAYKFYKDDTPEGWTMSHEFKKTFCMDISVYFIGVFDSVASVGFIPRKLPLSSTPSNRPLYFRHAMGLDEHRSKFKVCRYQQRDHIGPDSPWSTMAEMHEQPTAQQFSASHSARRSTSGTLWTEGPSSESSHTTSLEKHEKLDMPESTPRNQSHEKRPPPPPPPDCLEVWFAGCHADVGGGAVKNEVRHKLSQIPLRWMIRQCFECDTGILFNTHRLAEEGLDVHTLWPIYNRLQEPVVGPGPKILEKYEKGEIGPISRRSTVLHAVNEHDREGAYNIKIWQDDEKKIPAENWVPEQIEDYFDSLSPINDQLVQAKGWWILEVWPVKIRVLPKNSDVWVKKVAMNLGRYRPVQETDPNLHWTVQQRIYDQRYKIRTHVTTSTAWQIVV
ncbi:hypothetical protein MBLNU459_g3810t1 [Dothideomycetes sp. NU459]